MKETPPTYVYFISGAGLTRIGLTSNPQSALEAMQHSSPVPLALDGSFLGNHRTESLLHTTYADRHSHGEWFHGSFPVTEIQTWLTTRREAKREASAMHARSARANAKARERADEEEVRLAARSAWERQTDATTDPDDDVSRLTSEATESTVR